MDIRVSNQQSIAALLTGLQESSGVKTDVSNAVLKKTLDADEQKANQLLQMLTGVGRNFDKRV